MEVNFKIKVNSKVIHCGLSFSPAGGFRAAITPRFMFESKHLRQVTNTNYEMTWEIFYTLLDRCPDSGAMSSKVVKQEGCFSFSYERGGAHYSFCEHGVTYSRQDYQTRTIIPRHCSWDDLIPILEEDVQDYLKRGK